MAASSAAMLAYRDINNQSIKYTPSPFPSTSAPPPLNPIQFASAYDSDAEPLIPPSSRHIDLDPAPTELSEDALLRFTATGRPMPGFKFSNWQNLAGDMYSVPQLLPKRYTDESIIPAIVVDVIPSPKPLSSGDGGNREGAGKRRASLGFLGKLKRGRDEEKEKRGITKVVYMPRGDYLKWFARGYKGEYVGSEEYRRWSEEELEERFGRYRPVVPQKRKGSLSLF